MKKLPKIPQYVNKIDIKKMVPWICENEKLEQESCVFCENGKQRLSDQYYECSECNARMDCIMFLMCHSRYSLEGALDRLKFDREIWT